MAQAARQGNIGNTPHPTTAIGMRLTSPRRSSEITSVNTANTASVKTNQTVGGRRPASNAAKLSAANAATSPNGTNTTRVTEKISTSPSPASR